MEQAIGTGIGICIGSIVALVIASLLFAVFVKVWQRHRLKQLGDAWLRSVHAFSPESRENRKERAG